MFPGCLQDFSRMFSGCSDGSYWPGGIWWSFQMKVWTLKIQRNPMIPNYLMIPAAAIRWSPVFWWSIRSMDFDNRKVYGDTSITDGLVFLKKFFIFFENSFVFWENLKHLIPPKNRILYTPRVCHLIAQPLSLPSFCRIHSLMQSSVFNSWTHFEEIELFY